MRRRIGKDGHCRRTGKIRYRDEKSARTVIRRARPMSPGQAVPVRAYQCALCGGWHLTSQAKERP